MTSHRLTSILRRLLPVLGAGLARLSRELREHSVLRAPIGLGRVADRLLVLGWAQAHEVPDAAMLVLVQRFADQAALAAGALLVTQQLLMSFSAVVYNVEQVSYRQAITPLSMQGRMNATMRFIVWGTMPLGSLIGGLLASVFPVRATILVGALVASTAFLWVLFSPVRTLREIPTVLPAEQA